MSCNTDTPSLEARLLPPLGSATQLHAFQPLGICVGLPMPDQRCKSQVRDVRAEAWTNLPSSSSDTAEWHSIPLQMSKPLIEGGSHFAAGTLEIPAASGSFELTFRTSGGIMDIPSADLNQPGVGGADSSSQMWQWLSSFGDNAKITVTESPNVHKLLPPLSNQSSTMIKAVIAHVARVLAGPLAEYGIPSNVPAADYASLPSKILDPMVPLPALTSTSSELSMSSPSNASSTATQGAYPSAAAVIETAYVVSILHAAVTNTQHNTPHVQQRASSFALAELFASLPLLRQPTARAKLLSKMLGCDAITATKILDQVGRIPLHSVLHCADSHLVMREESAGVIEQIKAKRFFHLPRVRRRSDTSGAPHEHIKLEPTTQSDTHSEVKVPKKSVRSVYLKAAAMPASAAEDLEIEGVPRVAAKFVPTLQTTATATNANVPSVSTAQDGKVLQLTMDQSLDHASPLGSGVSPSETTSALSLHALRQTLHDALACGRITLETAIDCLLLTNSDYEASGAAASMLSTLAVEVDVHSTVCHDNINGSGKGISGHGRPGSTFAAGSSHDKGMTAHQRAIFTFARWTSGGHFDAADPLHALSLDLLINCLQFVNPTFVHRNTVVHVLTTLCTSSPTSIVRVYYARALRTLFARGTPTHAATVKRAGDRKPVPNLAKSVIIAVHDILHAHLLDVAYAQQRSRKQELPPMSPAAAALSITPGVAMPQLSTPAFPPVRHEVPSPNWSSLAPRPSPRTPSRQLVGSRAAMAADDVAVDSPADHAAHGFSAARPTAEELAVAADPTLRLKAASDKLDATARHNAQSMHSAKVVVDSVQTVRDPFFRRSDSTEDIVKTRSGSPPRAAITWAATPVGELHGECSKALPSSHVLSLVDRKRLDTSKSDIGFDLQVLMGFVGDLLHESKAAAGGSSSRGTAPAPAKKSSKARSKDSTSSASTAEENDSGSGRTPGGCDTALSCGSCGGPCAIRISTLTVTIGAESRDGNSVSAITVPGALEGAREVGYQAPSPTAIPMALETTPKSAFDFRSPVVPRPYTHAADTSKHGADGSVEELHVLRAKPSTMPAPKPAVAKAKPAAENVKIAGPVTITPLDSAALPLPPSAPTDPSLGKPAKQRAALTELCPSADKGGVSLGLWMEASRAIAHAAVKLSSIPESGDGITPEYRSVLACALQLCSACPLLREIVLRRILRKWPTGNSDNEIALLEFLATVLATTTHRADLVVTDLRSLMLVRILRCLRSTHIKVARNALVLIDPHRKLCDFLLDDPVSMRRLLDIMSYNVLTHWSPLVKRASATCLTVYKAQYDQRWGIIERQEDMDAIMAAAATQNTAGLSKWVHNAAAATKFELGPYQPPSSVTLSMREELQDVPPRSRRESKGARSPSSKARRAERHRSRSGSTSSEDDSEHPASPASSRSHGSHKKHRHRHLSSSGDSSDTSSASDSDYRASPSVSKRRTAEPSPTLMVSVESPHPPASPLTRSYSQSPAGSSRQQGVSPVCGTRDVRQERASPVCLPEAAVDLRIKTPSGVHSVSGIRVEAAAANANTLTVPDPCVEVSSTHISVQSGSLSCVGGQHPVVSPVKRTAHRSAAAVPITPAAEVAPALNMTDVSDARMPHITHGIADDAMSSRSSDAESDSSVASAGSISPSQHPPFLTAAPPLPSW